MQHGIEHAMLQQEFTALKFGRQLLPDGLLNHPRSGETNQRSRLGNIQVHELQRIGGDQIPIKSFVLVIVQQLRQTSAGVDAEVFFALRTHVQVLFQVLLPDNLPAAVALYPQPFGADFLLARGIQFAGLSFEPSHKNIADWVMLTVDQEPERPDLGWWAQPSTINIALLQYSIPLCAITPF